MSVYLNRFLNVPAAKIPEIRSNGHRAGDVLEDELPALFDHAAAGESYRHRRLAGRTSAPTPIRRRCKPLWDGCCCARIAISTASRVWRRLFRSRFHLPIRIIASHFMIATARYLAAHAPTVRAQGQTFHIAERLYRGEHVFDEATAHESRL